MRALLTERLLRAIRRDQTFGPGERVGVGVSGGSDSVALLRLLAELAPELGINLSVVHFNHRLRGEESDGDEQFVKALALGLGLPFFCAGDDVATIARNRHWNLEDAGRRLRYAFFASLVETGKLTHITVAHTADDQAETVLSRLARGTGFAGLGAIHPRNGHVIRPLLEVRRQELREYLARIAQSWREDSSNSDTSRLRARVRHKVLPVLERELQPAVVEHLGRLAQMAREDEAFWQAFVGGRLKLVLQREADRLGIRCADLLSPLGPEGLGMPGEAHAAVAGRLVREIVREVRGNRRGLTAAHVDQALRLASTRSSGRHIELPGIRVERSFEWLWFSTAPQVRRDESDRLTSSAKGRHFADFSHVFDLGTPGQSTVVTVPQIGRRFRLKVIDWPVGERDTNLSIGQSALDRDLLASPLIFRNWRPGDAFWPQGRRSSHKLKDFLQANKVAVGDRKRWPVLTSRDAVAWTRGLPPAVEFSPGKATRRVVVISEEEI